MWRSTIECRGVLRYAASAICAMGAAVLLAGCAPAYNSRPAGYGAPPGSRGTQCYQGCGYVREVRQVQLQNRSGAVLGTVIGAVAGGLLGHQVGGGSGKTAATVAGAVAGGVAGHHIGERRGSADAGWQVVVQLDNGQYATVTQSGPPSVRVGDYVMIRGDEVYRY